MKVISLGWGVQSWTLAAMSALGELEPVDVALHSDTTWEAQATYDFARQWTPWLEERGVRVVTVRGKDTSPIVPLPNGMDKIILPAHTTYEDGSPSGFLRRQCTHRWKIQPMRQWLREQGATKVELWLGITIDEIERAKMSDVQWITNRFPLLEKRMTRARIGGCIDWLRLRHLPVPPQIGLLILPIQNQGSF